MLIWYKTFKDPVKLTLCSSRFITLAVQSFIRLCVCLFGFHQIICLPVFKGVCMVLCCVYWLDDHQFVIFIFHWIFCSVVHWGCQFDCAFCERLIHLYSVYTTISTLVKNYWMNKYEKKRNQASFYQVSYLKSFHVSKFFSTSFKFTSFKNRILLCLNIYVILGLWASKQ